MTHPCFRTLFSVFAGCAAFLLCVAAGPAAAEEPQTNAPAPLRQGDALLVRIEGLGGGLPEYREIVDSDGQIELPFLGFLSAEGKLPAEVETEMATAYSNANLSTTCSARITFVQHFEPPPSRANLIRSQDPRQPVLAPSGTPIP